MLLGTRAIAPSKSPDWVTSFNETYKSPGKSNSFDGESPPYVFNESARKPPLRSMLARPSNTGPGCPKRALLYVVPRTKLTTSPSVGPRRSLSIPKLPQVGLNHRIPPCRFRLPLTPLIRHSRLPPVLQPASSTARTRIAGCAHSP